jgi:hypothetical protein
VASRVVLSSIESVSWLVSYQLEERMLDDQQGAGTASETELDAKSIPQCG